MEALTHHHVTDSAETVETEIEHGSLDALLDLYNAGKLEIAEVKTWHQTGELSDHAKQVMAEAACQGA